MGLSKLDEWLTLPPKDQEKFVKSLTQEEAEHLRYSWDFYARPNQLAPEGNWQTWLIRAGRGFGKTRSGAEWVRAQVEQKKASRISLVAATSADARDTMVEGESGILAISPPWCRPIYEPSKRRLTWPNGAMATTYSAEEPDRLRGPQCDAAWCDETAAWKYDDAWDQLLFGLRLGRDPRVVITTTPRPTELIRRIRENTSTVETVGSTFENKSNLAPSFFDQVISRYEGTRLGRQEIYAEILDDIEDALWKRENIDQHRVRCLPDNIIRTVIGVDPAATANKNSDETGIIAAARDDNDHYYIIEDASIQASPDAWGRAAVRLFNVHSADRIIAEINMGGDMVESVIRTIDKKVPYKAVRASKGKYTRAEPIAALYEQGRVHHVGSLPKLEDQQCLFTADQAYVKSPDRVDALVWALTELSGRSASSFLGAILPGEARPSPWKI